MSIKQLQLLAREHGTPLVVINHDIIRRNYSEFKKYLPKVQVYYALKANPAPEIVRTLYKAGASFDVASLPEFMLVYENIKHLPPKDQHLPKPRPLEDDQPSRIRVRGLPSLGRFEPVFQSTASGAW